MMAHRTTAEDQAFLAQFESGEFPPAEFDHRARLRLAYVYLTEHYFETAYRLMREALQRFLEQNGVDPSKYHDTMTHAWMLAVRHFMEATSSQDSADSFAEKNPEMLDSDIMMTHYSADVLFSDEARTRFVEPDRDPIPRHSE